MTAVRFIFAIPAACALFCALLAANPAGAAEESASEMDQQIIKRSLAANASELYASNLSDNTRLSITVGERVDPAGNRETNVTVFFFSENETAAYRLLSALIPDDEIKRYRFADDGTRTYTLLNIKFVTGIDPREYSQPIKESAGMFAFAPDGAMKIRLYDGKLDVADTYREMQENVNTTDGEFEGSNNSAAYDAYRRIYGQG